jgi:hypothetical protein
MTDDPHTGVVPYVAKSRAGAALVRLRQVISDGRGVGHYRAAVVGKSGPGLE